jgi:hypothetical protein
VQSLHPLAMTTTPNMDLLQRQRTFSIDETREQLRQGRPVREAVLSGAVDYGSMMYGDGYQSSGVADASEGSKSSPADAPVKAAAVPGSWAARVAAPPVPPPEGTQPKPPAASATKPAAAAKSPTGDGAGAKGASGSNNKSGGKEDEPKKKETASVVGQDAPSPSREGKKPSKVGCERTVHVVEPRKTSRHQYMYPLCAISAR